MELESRTISRIAWRFIPFLMLCYLIAYLDRSNIGFGGLQMNSDIGLSAGAYGFGAGLFFVSYCLCEIPSNLVLYRVGARRWIARIMLAWGVVAVSMALVWNERSFYVVRLLLGAAEAGFQPGVLFFLTSWFPKRYRARMVGLFMASVPLSGLIGSPLSGQLLGLNGVGGLRGWQWLYIVEGAPAMVVAFFVLKWLTDEPSKADWLSDEERDWLLQEKTRETQSIVRPQGHGLLQALADPRVPALGLLFLSNSMLLNANVFFLPQVVKAFGLSNQMTGFVAAIPSLVGLVAVIWWGRHSDKHGERRWHAAIALFVGGLGLALSVVLPHPLLRLISLSLALAGTYGFTPAFWSMPGSFLTGAAAAGGIAAISALGNVGGFIAPSVVGRLQEITGNVGAGQMLIAGIAMIAALLLVKFGPRRA
jgi:ACS family tartrate transporter-like MFS transporter